MKTKVLITLFAGALTLMSCSEDFLETEPTEFISSDQVARASELNPGLQEANIAGIYSTMYLTGTGGTTGHDDFGQKGYDIYSDMLSGDMVLAGLTYGWYSTTTQLQSTVDFTTNQAYIGWRYYYRIIFAANTVIDQLGGNDAELENEEARHYMGQAKAMRGYAHFYLSQLYVEAYNPSAPALPIYTDTQVPNQPLSTTEEVYTQIVSDLTDAVELLEGFNRGGKFQVNKSVAQGLLAYTYGVMGRDAEVKEITADIINNGGYRIMTAEEVVRMRHDGPDTDPYGGGFDDLSNPGWMWGVDLNLDMGLNLISWWGQIDMFSYSYAWAGDPKTIDEGLYQSIREDDVRKNQFMPVNSSGLRVPSNKFYHEDRIIGGQRYMETDYVFMRIAEMYLLHAEASAKTGDEENARETLKVLLEERVADASYVDGLSGQALLDEIYLQTRIELWGEGKSYLAMKRNRATITRGENHLSFPGESFSYDDPRLTFPIPQAEILNNPNIN